MSEEKYIGNDEFKRRYLYIQEQYYEKIAIDAIKKKTNVSNVLNEILECHYSSSKSK